MKLFTLSAFVLFLIFSIVQFNDPDPVLWITLYLVPAYIAFRASKRKINPDTLMVLIPVYIAFAANGLLQMKQYDGFFTESKGFEMTSVNQELLRESSGILLAVLFYIILLVIEIRTKRNS